MMKTIPWALFAFALIYIFVKQACNNTKTATDTVSVTEYKALQTQITDTVHYYTELLKADSAAIENATTMAMQANEKLQQYEAKINASNEKILQLTDKIEEAKKLIPDASFIPVSPLYIENCDSLSTVARNSVIRVNEYKGQVNEYKKVLDYEIALRDTAISNRDRFIAQFKAQLNDCMQKLGIEVKGDKKRAQLWWGLDGMGNKNSFGVQSDLLLITPRNKAFSLGGGWFENELFGKAGVKFLIH